jgi:hypothetical protein
MRTAFEFCHRNRVQAAKLLGISRTDRAAEPRRNHSNFKGGRLLNRPHATPNRNGRAKLVHPQMSTSLERHQGFLHGRMSCITPGTSFM